jgi:hypothetical protein
VTVADQRKRLAADVKKARDRLVWGTVEKYPRARASVRIVDVEHVLGELDQATEQKDLIRVMRQRQNLYLYDQWDMRIAHCGRTDTHDHHGWVGGNEDLRCPGTPVADGGRA